MPLMHLKWPFCIVRGLYSLWNQIILWYGSLKLSWSRHVMVIIQIWTSFKSFSFNPLIWMNFIKFSDLKEKFWFYQILKIIMKPEFKLDKMLFLYQGKMLKLKILVLSFEIICVKSIFLFLLKMSDKKLTSLCQGSNLNSFNKAIIARTWGPPSCQGLCHNKSHNTILDVYALLGPNLRISLPLTSIREFWSIGKVKGEELSASASALKSPNHSLNLFPHDYLHL